MADPVHRDLAGLARALGVDQLYQAPDQLGLQAAPQAANMGLTAAEQFARYRGQLEAELQAQQARQMQAYQLQHLQDQLRARGMANNTAAYDAIVRDAYAPMLEQFLNAAPGTIFRYPAGASPTKPAPDPAVLERALSLLESKIGRDAVAKIQNGGAYTIPSQLWDGVIYHVPKAPHERVRVVDRGSVVTEVCIVTTDPTIPWPDVMLQRITAIRLDESVLFATGVIHDRRPVSWMARARERLQQAFA